jgi:hypothetical protein
MQARGTCVIVQAGTIGFHLKIPKIYVFVVYIVEGRRMKYECVVLG